MDPQNSPRQPLAERMRPKTLADVLGQDQVIGEGKMLTEIAKKKEPVNLIFWGPPGTGKTTLARILATEFDADFIELSAVTAHKSDVEAVVERAKQNWNLKIRTLLFVDEIHRFNKAQQDAFLPHVESGLITLIGATTENPSFEVIPALLSRSRVVVLKNLDQESILKILQRAVTKESRSNIQAESLELISQLANGDARSALGDLEICLSLGQKVTPDLVLEAVGKKVINYDKDGDYHYDTISAFIKSMRGSDVDATLYYLARMLEGGEDPKFVARRMVIFASEDIGLGGNGALGLAVSAFQAVERIGMPESGIILSHAAAALAKSKKDRSSYDAWNRAKDLARNTRNLPIPLGIRNSPTKLMKDLGYAKGYKWEAGFHHDVSYLPDEIKDQKIYFPTKP
jgi:AAA ATPase, central domain protein